MPQWTPQQKLAIETTGCDLLVSASAGTGKTAVLVERIARLALDGEQAIDLDRFLVVTFTEAAASEMRERIGEALRARLATDPRNHPIRRQLLLLDKAQISTLHAFCKSLLKKNFHALGLDPEFAILSEDEGRLMRSEAAREVLQEAFERGERSFFDFLETFQHANPELQARSRLLWLHQFMQSLENPEEWASGVRREYPLDANGDGILRAFADHEWFPAWRDALVGDLDSLRADMAALLNQAQGLMPKHIDYYQPFLTQLDEAREAADFGDWGRALAVLQGYAFSRAPAVRKADATEQILSLKDRFAAVRKRFTDDFLASVASGSPEQLAGAHAAAAPAIHLLLDLVERFHLSYSGAKHRRAVLDFNDLEQMALRLLRGSNGAAHGSEVAQACRRQYAYVLVDEYQDINPVQDAILTLVSRRYDGERANNLFAVGDVKQSIYAFRLAAPDIFLKKYHDFSVLVPSSNFLLAPDACARVDLTRNFRSREIVLRGVNFVFERLMRLKAGGIDYDQSARLEAGGAFPDLSGKPIAVEVHLLDRDETETGEESSPSEDWNATEREAFLAGKRILEMTGRSGTEPVQVFDRNLPGGDRAEASALRPASLRDVVILLRSVALRAETYAAVLERMGIAVYCDKGSGLFAATEVRDILNLFRIIDNPRQDIPLTSTLRSPLEGWSDADLAQVRRAQPRGPFHEAFLAAAADVESVIGRRAAEFLKRLDAWRTQARRAPLADLLSTILEETGYVITVLGWEGGSARRANLERLRDLAREFDTFSRQGLGRFLRFMDQLRSEQGDYGAASPLGESRDVVRIMSIHKSKGLEFPIVFLSGLGTRFNLRDAYQAMLMSRKGGLALEVTDIERAVRFPTPGLSLMRRAVRHDQLAEEMRILYVAMTRARERLLLTGSLSNLSDKMEDWKTSGMGVTGSALSSAAVMGARSFLDWIGPIVGPSWPNLPERTAGNGFDVSVYSADDMVRWVIPKLDGLPFGEEGVPAFVPEDVLNGKMQKIFDRIQWEYPHVALCQSPARLSVSEIKRRLDAGNEVGERSARQSSLEKEYDLTEVLSDHASWRAGGRNEGEDVVVPSERGTLTHLVLQHLDLVGRLDYAGISSQMDVMIERGLLTEEQRQAVDLKAIATFFETDLAQRLLALPLDKVWREVPFLLGLSPSEAGLTDLGAYDEGEKVRVQGVMDLVALEGEGLLLIDYKTDVITPEIIPIRKRHYQAQMCLYAQASEAVFGYPLKEMYLYFLALNHAEPVSLERFVC